MKHKKLMDMNDAPNNQIQMRVPDPDKRFIGWLVTSYIDGQNTMLVNDFGYMTQAGEIATARKGFVFDWASIPRPLQIIYPPAGDGANYYGVAAVFHDWLYAHRKIGGRVIQRKEADDLFYEIMRYVGCRRTLAWTMWLAVRTAGWMPWNKRKPEDIIP
ncbi:MAG: DUF1353 domain-containing protein [Patescibacteria group bacterium]